MSRAQRNQTMAPGWTISEPWSLTISPASARNGLQRLNFASFGQVLRDNRLSSTWAEDGAAASYEPDRFAAKVMLRVVCSCVAAE